MRPADDTTPDSSSELAPQPWFAEIADGAGVAHPHGSLAVAPNCVFNQVAGEDVRDGPPSGREALILRASTLGSAASSDLMMRGMERAMGARGATDEGGSCLSERNSGSVAVGDFDGDGLPDLYASRLDGPPALFRNTGDGAFEDVTAESGIIDPVSGGSDSGASSRSVEGGAPLLAHGSNGAAFFDADNDGDVDLYVTTIGRHRHALFINTEGRGAFTEEAVARGAQVASLGDPSMTSGGSIGVGDYDGDGWLDLYVTEWRMYYTRDLSRRSDARTDGDGHRVGDGDGDGGGDARQPLLSNSRLLRNLGARGPQFAGHFEDATDAAGVNLEPVARRMLEQHFLTQPVPERDARHGIRRTIANGVFSFSPVFADFDGDSHVDLFVASDFMTTVMFWGKGDGTFSEAVGDDGDGEAVDGTHAAGLGREENGMGASVADVDGDGWLDIFVTAIHRHQPLDVLTGFGTRGNTLYRFAGADAGGSVDGGGGGGRGGGGGAARRAFTEWTLKAGVEAGEWGWGCALADIDNDGDVDALHVNGYILPESTFDDEWNVTPTHLWLNPRGDTPQALCRGDAGDSDIVRDIGAAAEPAMAEPVSPWLDVAGPLGIRDFELGRGLAVVDVDLDGDLDVFVSSFAGPARLFRNDGAGAVVSEAEGGSGGGEGQSEAVVHFGLGVWSDDDEAAYVGGTATGLAVNVSVTWPAVRVPAHDADAAGRVVPVPAVTVRYVGVTADAVLVVHRPDLPASTTAAGGADGVSTGAAARAGAAAPTQACPASVSPRELPPLRPLRRNAALEPNARTTLLVDKDVRPKSPRVRPKASAPPWLHHVTHSMPHAVSASIIGSDDAASVAPIDGVGNNEEHPLWGAAMTPLTRRTSAAYEDGVSEPRGGGVASPAPTLPSARAVSNALFAATAAGGGDGTDVPCPAGQSEVAVHFGQLLAHDLDLTTPQANAATESFFPIPVPRGDPTFDPEGHGGRVVRFRRSIYDPSTGTDAGNPRQQVNKVTAFVDASSVYGSDAGRLRALRTLTGGGQLRTAADDASPPPNVDGLANDNPLARPVSHLLVAGDVRANIQPGLLAMHTLFVREHNYIAGVIQGLRLAEAMASVSDGGDADGSGSGSGSGSGGGGSSVADDAVFSAARRLLMAEFQAIVYNEYLPALLGPHAIPPYTGYNASVDPSIATEFATAAFRFGHSQVSEHLAMVYAAQPRSRGGRGRRGGDDAGDDVGHGDGGDEGGDAMVGSAPGESRRARMLRRAKRRGRRGRDRLTPSLHDGHGGDGGGGEGDDGASADVGSGASDSPAPGSVVLLPLNESYFSARQLLSGHEGGIDPLLRGMVARPAQAVDALAVDGVRNFLFGPVGAGGVDLVATNIQRGRDHGVADYNTVREAYGLGRKRTFLEVTGGDEGKADALAGLYPGGVDSVDLFVAGLCEPRAPPSALGETFTVIVADQFRRLRDGDRFFYASAHGGLGEAGARMMQSASMADVLARHVHFGRGVPAEVREAVAATRQAGRAVGLGPDGVIGGGGGGVGGGMGDAFAWYGGGYRRGNVFTVQQPRP